MAPRPKATPRITGEAAALELERPLATGLSPGRALTAHFHAPEGMVLLKEPPGLTGFFAGSLGSLSMEDVFAHVLGGLRSGQLVVQHGALRRTVAFRDGQVVFATSTERYERLGTVLMHLGLLTAEQLARAVAQVSPTQRLSQVLASQAVVSEANLYSGMTYLVREVVLALFEMTEGSFLFLEGHAPQGDAVSLPERTRDLVLQGLRRGEAVARLRRRFPDDMRVAPGPDAAPPGEEALFARARQGVTLRELRAAYEGSVYAFLMWVEERVRGEALVVQPPELVSPRPATLPAEVLGSELLSAEERYNLMLSLVCRAFQEAGKDPGVLRAFLDAPHAGLEGAYAGVALGPDGRVDVERIRRNVAGGDEARTRVRVLGALGALVSYALFSAKNMLPAEVAERLALTYRALQEGLT